MKIIKGVFTYILILLGVIFIAGILMTAFMAFTKTRVFGYNFVMSNGKETVVSVEGSTVFKMADTEGKKIDIVINSNDFDVDIVGDRSANKNGVIPTICIYDESFGFVKNGVTKAYLDADYYDASGNQITDNSQKGSAAKIVYNIITPNGGLCTARDSKVLFILPSPKAKIAGYNFTINSGKGNVNISPTNIQETGDVEYGNLQVSELVITTTSGDVKVSGLSSPDSYVTLTKLDLRTETGKMDFTEQNIEVKDGEPNTAKVKIQSRRGDFRFKDLTGQLVVEGENIVLEAETIKTNLTSGRFSYNCPNGTLRIGTLQVYRDQGLVEIVTEYARVEIGAIIGDTLIQSTYGSTFITEAYSNVLDITTTHGDISVGNALYSNIVADVYVITKVKNPAWFFDGQNLKKESHDVQCQYFMDWMESGDDKLDENFEYEVESNVEITAEEFAVLGTNEKRMYMIKEGKNVESKLALRSTYGNISVGNYVDSGWFTNKFGKITVNQKVAAVDQETIITSEKGTVTATNIMGKLTAKATGSADMNITFANIPKHEGTEIVNKITIGSGKLTLNVPAVKTGDDVVNKSYEYKLTYRVIESGKLNIYNGTTIDNSYESNSKTPVNDGVLNNTVTNKYHFEIYVNGGLCNFVKYNHN